MKFKFRNTWRDIICPLGLSVGTLLLFYLIIAMAFYSKGGLWASALVAASWVYGIVFVDDIIPFWKRVFSRKGGKENG